MPRRSTSGIGGFSGTASNPFITYPGGRVTVSDVNDARNAMSFGGEQGAPRASMPWPRTTTGEPQVQAINNRTTRDIASWDGRPIVESGTDIFPSQTREQTFVHDPNERYFSIPHNAMDFTDTSVTAGVEPRGPASGSLQATATRPVGEPTVQTPTTTPAFASAGNLDAEPSLFQNAAVNPFDEWWKTPMAVTANASAGAEAGTGGSIWGEATPVFSVAESATATAGMDMSGASGAAFAAPKPPDETTFNQPPPPGPIPVQGTEWTTSPEDRRFLPTAQESQPAQRTTAGTGDIRNFAGQGFGNPISLGAYLSTPLSNLNYGEGYPTGEASYGGPPTAATGRLNIDPSTGQPYDLNSIPSLDQGGTDTTGWRDNARSTTFDDEGRDVSGGTTWDSSGRDNAQSNSGNEIPTLDPITVYADPSGLNTGSPSFGLNGQYGTSLHVTRTARDFGSTTRDPGGLNAQSQENAMLMNFISSDRGAAPYRFQIDMPIQSNRLHPVRADEFGGYAEVPYSHHVFTPEDLAAAYAHASLMTTDRGRAQYDAAHPRGVPRSSQPQSTTATPVGGR